MLGPAISFQGQKIFCLHRGVIIGADVPHSANMHRALDGGDIRAAYRLFYRYSVISIAFYYLCGYFSLCLIGCSLRFTLAENMHFF
jgi:hypothetical protein